MGTVNKQNPTDIRTPQKTGNILGLHWKSTNNISVEQRLSSSHAFWATWQETEVARRYQEIAEQNQDNGKTTSGKIFFTEMHLVNCIFVALPKDLNATLLPSKLAYSYLEGALYARLRPLQVTFKHNALFSEDPDKKVIILSVKLNSSEISYC